MGILESCLCTGDEPCDYCNEKFKGPWVSGHFGELQEDDGLKFTRIYGPGENVIICDVYDDEFTSRIEAVPDLLKVIKAALSIIETPGDLTEQEKLWIIDDLVTAIKKAEGR